MEKEDKIEVIEITPEMIEAGVTAANCWGDSDRWSEKDFVKTVYLAMAAASRTNCKSV